MFFGIQEVRPNEDTPTIVNEFLESRLDITSIKIAHASRLGRRLLSTRKLRPILVTFHSKRDKNQVILKHATLAGSKVFMIINNDLTKEQMQDIERNKEKLVFNSKGRRFQSTEISYGWTVPSLL